MKSFDEIKKEIHEENEKTNKLEENVKKEFSGYKKDIMAKDVNIYDEKPLIQKTVFFLAGLTNFLVGFAIYFLIRDNNKMKWQASYLVKGSACGIILSIIIAVMELVSVIAGKA